MENKKIDFSNTEICKEIYIGDEAVEILGRYFLGISPDLPLVVEAGSVISLFEIKVSLRSDGKYKFDFKGPRVTLTEKNPDCEEYVIYLNGEPYGKISSSK
jgi:hypothetical protein